MPLFRPQVRTLLHKKIREAYIHPQFVSDVMKPLTIEPLMDQEVQNLSGGELQRVALAMCLGQPADIYLIDEPSAYLDSEQRIMASKVGGWLGWLAGRGARSAAAGCGAAFAPPHPAPPPSPP